MTREESLSIITEAIEDYVCNYVTDTAKAQKMLNAIQTLEQVPCEDAISRQAVIDITWEEPSYTDALNVLTEVRDKVKALPPVKPQENTGHWITKIKSDLRGDMWPTNPKCSECGGEPYYSNTIYNYKFCPYCGAKMVEPQESDHTCHTCKHYTSGEHDGSCGSYICKGYSDWESEDKE